MVATVDTDRAYAELVSLDVLDAALDGALRPNWGFFDEVLRAAHEYHWPLRKAARAVIGSRARKAGCRESVDVEGMMTALERLLPSLER